MIVPLRRDLSRKQRFLALIPALAAIAYPFWLDAFHHAVTASVPATAATTAAAAVCLLAAFAMPAVGLLYAWKLPHTSSLRRLAYAAVAAPTLYVFFGVEAYMMKSRLPDELLWSLLWVILAGIAFASPGGTAAGHDTGRWRKAHALSAGVVIVYILFHIVNHLFGLGGYALHREVEVMGEHVYRAPVLEPLLVLLLIFQVITGVRLFWRWSMEPSNFHQTFQLASGLFLAVYVIGHMNSVIVFARSYLGIVTTFEWASGETAGLIHDAWNIRLLPHYMLGVFFALSHAASGGRAILFRRGTEERLLNRLWLGAVVISALTAIVIILVMTGLRV